MGRSGRVSATAAVAVLAGVFLAMPVSGSSDGSVVLIAVPDSPPPFEIIERGASRTADDRSVPYVRYDLTGGSEEEWVDEVAALAGTASALIIDSPIEVPKVIERAAELDIPVVATLRGEPSTPYDVLVRMDDADAGWRAANVMTAAIEEHGMSGAIVAIDCPPEGADVARRVSAFTDNLNARGTEVIPLQSTASEPGEATTLLGGVFQEGTTVAGVLACNAPIALGALDAIAEAGLDSTTDITTVTFGWDPSALGAVADGQLSATLAQDFLGIGAAALRVASRLADGSEPRLDDAERRVRFVPYVLVTSENVAEFRGAIEAAMEAAPSGG